MTGPLLQLRGVTKTFGTLVANDHVDLDVAPGRIHALVGENGAGKTTLMSMINGTAVPDSGTITYDGVEVSITSPQQAAALGIGMVFQHFKLVGSLTVAANVFLGREITKSGQLDTDAMEAEVTRLSSQFGLEVVPTEITSDLSVGELQRVEVLKALSHKTRLLILDEPTAVLTPSETDDLFVVVRELAKSGVAVIFISHKLDEVLAIADEVTVIRDGRVIDTVPAAGLTKERIATMMVGREVLLRIEHTPAHPGDTVLDVAGPHGRRRPWRHRAGPRLPVRTCGRDRRHRRCRRQRPVRAARVDRRPREGRRGQRHAQGRRHHEGVRRAPPRVRTRVHPRRPAPRRYGTEDVGRRQHGGDAPQVLPWRSSAGSASAA